MVTAARSDLANTDIRIVPFGDDGGMGKLDGLRNVRFAPGQIAGVRYLADRDGLSVSAWIRRVVEREVAAREGRCPACGSDVSAATAPRDVLR